MPWCGLRFAVIQDVVRKYSGITVHLTCVHTALMRLNISCLLELGRDLWDPGCRLVSALTWHAVGCETMPWEGAAFLLHRVKSRMFVVLRLLHVETTWLETQWGVEGWAVMCVFALNKLIFFEIWGTFSLAEIRQDFHVPSGTCVCKTYVMEDDRLWQTFHLSHVNKLSPLEEQAWVRPRGFWIGAGFAQWQLRAWM